MWFFCLFFFIWLLAWELWVETADWVGAQAWLLRAWAPALTFQAPDVCRFRCDAAHCTRLLQKLGGRMETNMPVYSLSLLSEVPVM